MKTIRLMAVVVGLLVAQMAIAQAPAGSTGQCKDGTYTTTATKQGACRGHQGVKEWYATSSAATSAKPSAASSSKAATASPAAPAAAASPATAAAPAKTANRASMASAAAAPGGGPGMVWLNSGTNIYHCSGSQFYGKTKSGAYMSEADAKAKGARPDHNKPCTK